MGGKMKKLIILACSIVMQAAPIKLGTVQVFEQASAQQEQIELGFAFLHNFMFTHAERTLNAAMKANPNPWAMVGLLASQHHSLWHHTYYDKANKYLTIAKKLKPKDPIASELITAFAILFEHKADSKLQFCEHLKKLYQKYPNNSEVTAFYGLSLMADKGDLTASRLVLKRGLNKWPNHPGLLHYYIHANDFDDKQLINEALPYARHYFNIAKDASHGLHMPSHLFVRLKLWQESINANYDSVKASENICSRFSQDEFCDAENKLHSIEWLHYSYLNQKQYDKALNLFDYISKNIDKVNSNEIRRVYTIMLARNLQFNLSNDLALPKPINTDTNHDFWSIYSEAYLLSAKAMLNKDRHFTKIKSRLNKLVGYSKDVRQPMQAFVKLSIAHVRARELVNQNQITAAIKLLKQNLKHELNLNKSEFAPGLGYVKISEHLQKIAVNNKKKPAK